MLSVWHWIIFWSFGYIRQKQQFVQIISVDAYSMAGASNCSLCPVGHFENMKGALAACRVVAGILSVKIFLRPGASICSLCGAGSYSSVMGILASSESVLRNAFFDQTI